MCICWCGASCKDGSDLVISCDYISHGLRSRAEDLVSIELGPKSEHEIRSALARGVDTERWTRLDRAIRMAALVAIGLHDELTGEAYAIAGTDGRAHHVRFQGSRRPLAASSRCAGSAIPTSSADPAAAVLRRPSRKLCRLGFSISRPANSPA
jgi:hypothetical protein